MGERKGFGNGGGKVGKKVEGRKRKRKTGEGRNMIEIEGK